MKNRLLNALGNKEYRLISPHLQSVRLKQGTVLYEAGESIKEIFFPELGTVSYLSGTADGETLEICAIGNEGLVGVAALFAESTAFRAVVQISGDAYVGRRDVLRKELKRCETFNRVVLQYTNALLVQIAQTAVCNKFHSVEERFCRSLLMANDRSHSNEIALTQESLARLLGSRRASVSVAAGILQKNGAIRYSRGVIRILDRKHLESASCECYEIISAAHSKIG